MSDQQQSVWPDGAREAVQQANEAALVLYFNTRQAYDGWAESILTALEPFVQQRIADYHGPRQESHPESVIHRLRAEVARLREDGERLDWLERSVPNGDLRRIVDSGKVPAVWPSSVRGFIDAARSARGGEG